MEYATHRTRARLVAVWTAVTALFAVGCAAAASRRAANEPPRVSTRACPGGDSTEYGFDVATPAAQIQGFGVPRYPRELIAEMIEGSVLAVFVVDTMGAPEVATFKVVKSSHSLFTAAVRAALPQMRFVPARLKGSHALRQCVQVPFDFSFR